MKMEANSWGLIGAGSIGGELQRQLLDTATASRLGLSPLPAFVVRSSGIFDADGFRPGPTQLSEIDELPDVIFVATPTTDDGNAAHGYITQALGRDKIVVTAEKGAMANHFTSLANASDGFRRLGFNATVGGGTRLIAEAQNYCRDPGNVSQIHLALNGTLAAIFSAMGPGKGPGMSLEQAVDQAVQLGYAEPGTASPMDVIRAEADGDIPKKTAILFNALGLSPKVLDWTRLKSTLADSDIDRAAKQADRRRFIVSIYPEGTSDAPLQKDAVLGGFNVSHDGWQIVGGFQDTKANPTLASLASTSGPKNGFVIGLGPNNSHGEYTLTGPGAGAKPTVSTMLHDYSTISNALY